MSLPVLCAGELMWDLHAPRGVSLEEATSFSRVPGGAASNVALALVGEGIEAGVAGLVSDDAIGRGLRDALASRGVDTSALVFHPGRTGLVFIDGERERFVSYRPEVRAHPPLALANRFSGGVLHVGALDPDLESLHALLDLVERAKGDRATVTLDVNARPRAWRERALGPKLRALVGHADLVKASDHDLRVLAIEPGIEPARAELGLAPAATLVLTRGPAEITASGPWGELTLPVAQSFAGGAVGAGDAFSAGLVAAMLLEPRAPTARWWRGAISRGQAWAARHLARHIATP